MFVPSFTSGLWRVAAGGGQRSRVTTVDTAAGERAHVWPYRGVGANVGMTAEADGTLEVTVPVRAGSRVIGATFIATNYRPSLDIIRHYDRQSLENNTIPQIQNYPAIGFVRVQGPFNAQRPADSASRRRIFTCKPAAATPEAIPATADAAAAYAAALAAIQTPGPPAEKLALLRAAAQLDARRVALFAAAVRTPHCREAARIGDTPAEFALQQLLRASRTDAAARSVPADLAFDERRVPAFHRERAARAYAATASLREAELLRARALD